MNEVEPEKSVQHLESEKKTKKCPYCSEDILIDAVKCKHCGEWLDKEKMPEHKVEYKQEVRVIEQSNVQPLWHFIVLNIVSMGLYQIYWSYKNWQLIKNKEKSNITPILRAVFGVVFAYVLFEKIYSIAKEKGYKEKFNAEIVATIYVMYSIIISSLSYILKMPGTLSILSVLNFIPLIYVLKILNYYWRQEQPNIGERKGFTNIELILLVIGVFLWVVIISSTWKIKLKL